MLRVCAIYLLLLWSHVGLNADSTVEFDYEADIYYSNVSAFIDLNRDENITDATYYSELDIYKELAINTFRPNIFLVEAAIHPMGIGGLIVRDRDEDLYEKTNIQDNNMVKSLTAGFEEPYSFSFFFGRMMIFKRKDSLYK